MTGAGDAPTGAVGAGDGNDAAISRPSLSELDAFVAVVECGSFSKAAARLGVSQPTVSLRLQALEEALGLRLLNRRQGVSVTEAGRDVFHHARLTLSRVDELTAAAADLRTLQRGRIRVGFSTPAFAMPLIGRLLDAHPGLVVTTALDNTAGLVARIQACQLDVAIATLDAARPGLACHLVAEQHPGLCLRADDPWVARAAVPLAEVCGRRLIVREPGSMTRALFERSCAKAEIEPGDVVEVPSREAVKEAVAAGIGVGLVLSGEVGCDPRLAACAIGDVADSVGVHAVTATESVELPAVRALLALTDAAG
jgi:DNA-binding transcriptional LysR family regulator